MYEGSEAQVKELRSMYEEFRSKTEENKKELDNYKEQMNYLISSREYISCTLRSLIHLFTSSVGRGRDNMTEFLYRL